MRTAVDTAPLVAERVRESAAVKQAMLADSNLLELVRELGAACVNSRWSNAANCCFSASVNFRGEWHLSAIYYRPHDTSEDCPCWKPLIASRAGAETEIRKESLTLGQDPATGRD